MDPVEAALDEADQAALANPEWLTHQDVFSSIRRKLNT